MTFEFDSYRPLCLSYLCCVAFNSPLPWDKGNGLRQTQCWTTERRARPQGRKICRSLHSGHSAFMRASWWDRVRARQCMLEKQNIYLPFLESHLLMVKKVGILMYLFLLPVECLPLSLFLPVIHGIYQLIACFYFPLLTFFYIYTTRFNCYLVQKQAKLIYGVFPKLNLYCWKYYTCPNPLPPTIDPSNSP